MTYQGVRGSKTLGKAEARKVYLKLRDGDGWMECELYDKEAFDSHGRLPPELHIICPRCNGESIIPPSLDPTAKTIHVEYLDKPRKLEMPDTGEIVYQTARVSIDEVCTCNHPSPAGKGPCGWRFAIRDNVISRV